MYHVLIPDYLGQQVISGIRALQPNIVDVATDKTIFTWMRKSKYINRVYNISRPEYDENMFMRQLVSILAGKHYDLVLPFGLNSYYMCTKFKNLIQEKSNVFLPDQDRLTIANDKKKSADLCRKEGIDHPNYYEISGQNELRIIAKDIRFPVVVKARSCTGTEKGLRYANNKNELFKKYDEIESNISSGAFDYSNPLVQEFIPGYINDACTLNLDGKPMYMLTQKRALMYPIYGGVGAINITTKDEKLKKAAEKVIEAFNWNGPAQIEFKYDPRDKKYKLIEINPKLWGTLDLSIKAGFNFPKLILDYVTKGKIHHDLYYRENVQYVFRYPQAYLAKNQLKKIRRLDLYPNTENSREVYTDFCISDPIPDIFRAIASFRTLYSGEINNKTSNIDIDTVLGNVS